MILAQTNGSLLLVILATVIGSGGVAGAIAIWIKAKPEASKILIEAAGEVVVIQKGTIEDLQSRVEELQDEVANLKNRVRTEEANNRELRQENTSLRERLDAIEANGTPSG